VQNFPVQQLLLLPIAIPICQRIEGILMQGVFSQHLLRSITPPLSELPPPPFTLNMAYTIQLGHTQLLLLLQHYQLLALLKCLTFGILLGSVVEEGDFSELREREKGEAVGLP